MKYVILLLLSLIVAAAVICDAQKQAEKTKKTKVKNKTTVAPQVEVLDVLAKAKRCSPSKCKLPDCRCSDATLPRPKFKGKVTEIPQV